MSNRLLAILPLLPVAVLLVTQPDNPVLALKKWERDTADSDKTADSSLVGVQLLAYVTLAVVGHVATDRLIPQIKQYTLRKGISGKDLGKRGTALADKSV